MSNYSYGLDSYNDLQRKITVASRIANVIYQLGGSYLSDCEEDILREDEEVCYMVNDCLESLKNGIPWPDYSVRLVTPYCVLLDKPEMKYANLVRDNCKLYDFVIIDFLCSHISETSHFACVILAVESNLKYRCLGIPVEQWHEYKKLPHYKGE